jgi:two-component system sensor histidine kinase GlrK
LQLSKQQLLKNLANEIDNALNPVENAERMPETNRQQTIKTSLNKLKIIQQQLTQYHQALIAAPQHQREYLDAEQILETVITEAQSALEAKSITMQKTTEPLKIHAVYQHIHDIFEQLLHNATRYTPEAGEIRVTLSHVKDWLQLEVEDDGLGLSAEDRNLTFAPFYRHATNQNEAYENQPGLGLTLIREYVAQHQGKIDFIAPKPGYLGAHIRVQLPLAM